MLFFGEGDLLELLIFISGWIHDKIIKLPCNMKHIFENTSTTDFDREQEHGGFTSAIKMHIFDWMISRWGVGEMLKKWFEYSKQVVLQW